MEKEIVVLLVLREKHSKIKEERKKKRIMLWLIYISIIGLSC